MAGQGEGRRTVTGQHRLAPGHPLGQRLGRIGEHLPAGTVAQRLGIKFIRQHSQVGVHRGIDRRQRGQARRQVPAQTEIVGHRHPRRQDRRAPRGGLPQRPLIGCCNHHPGTSARGRGGGVHQHRVTRIVAGGHQNIQRSDPGRRAGDGDQRLAGRARECGDEHGPRGIGGPAATDPDHRSGPLAAGHRIQRALLHGGRGGTHLSAGQRRGSQQTVAIGLQQPVGVVEIDRGVGRTHVLATAICSVA